MPWMDVMDSSQESPDRKTRSSPRKELTAAASSTSSSVSYVPIFPVGPAGKRELRKALVRSSDPPRTISNFQQRHSLHSMFAKAFGTTPSYEYHPTSLRSNSSIEESGVSLQAATSEKVVETLDTDSVMTFLSHLGVRQHEVHKRLTDTLMKSLQEEISKSCRSDRILHLLKNCWMFTTTIPELRPVILALLKQLGEATPVPVLTALAERDKDNTQLLKHLEVFKSLSPLLKRLCWEADADKIMSGFVEEAWSSPRSSSETSDLELLRTTLLYDAIQPHIKTYCSNQVLIEAAEHPYVTTVRERRLLTSQRRALKSSNTILSTHNATSNTSSQDSIRGATIHPGIKSDVATTSADISGLASSGRAVAQIRTILSDPTIGSASTYRPKLLFYVMSVCMAQHGSSSRDFLGGRSHLHCTLVADLLLSAGGPLPKAYEHVLSFAHTLDECVQEGNISDLHLVMIQTKLIKIFEVDEDVKPKEKNVPTILAPDACASKDTRETASVLSTSDRTSETPTNSLKRQLHRIILAGLSNMKEADPQSLFLNPVTDSIAPGYSNVISKPMSILTMERKVQADEYISVIDWEQDVKLMFKNCINYNRGAQGQWFRGEALRQSKVFSEEIFPLSRKEYQSELIKCSVAIASVSGGNSSIVDIGSSLYLGKRSGEQSVIIEALPASNKRHKKDVNEEYLPSLPALACLLLADPFVVRIIIARVLRELRRGVMNGKSLPAAHSAVPSLLQLLHLARWSRPMCAVHGRKYFIPGCGVLDECNQNNVSTYVPFVTLRRYVPLLLRLFLESELDRRITQGGDLQIAAQLMDFHLDSIENKFWNHNDEMMVAVSLIQGALIFLCQPGMGNESSLAVTFPKFARALHHLADNLCHDRVFFLGLVQVLSRHKAKLPAKTRDAVLLSWLDWLQGVNQSEMGAILTIAHESLLRLLNEWSSIGNKVLPRDTLVKYAVDTVGVVKSSAQSESYFAELWRSNNAPVEFQGIKEQYERILKMLPPFQSDVWKKKAGIDNS